MVTVDDDVALPTDGVVTKPAHEEERESEGEGEEPDAGQHHHDQPLALIFLPHRQVQSYTT